MKDDNFYKGCIEAFLFELGDHPLSEYVDDVVYRRLRQGLFLGEQMESNPFVPEPISVIEIQYEDFNRLVSSTYNKIYNIQQQEGVRGQCVLSYKVPNLDDDFDFSEKHTEFTLGEVLVNSRRRGVSFKKWLDRTEPFFESMSSNHFYWQRNFYPQTEVILHDLLKRNVIQAGNYRIVLDWV